MTDTEDCSELLGCDWKKRWQIIVLSVHLHSDCWPQKLDTLKQERIFVCSTKTKRMCVGEKNHYNYVLKPHLQLHLKHGKKQHT